MELSLRKLLQTNDYTNTNCIITIENVNTTKELFRMCFDIFCRSLVILYGSPDGNGTMVERGTGNTLNLNSITESDIEFIKNKLRQIKIKVNTVTYDVKTAQLLDIIPCASAAAGKNVLQTSLQTIEQQPDDLPLCEYIVQYQSGEYIVEIYFEII